MESDSDKVIENQRNTEGSVIEGSFSDTHRLYY